MRVLVTGASGSDTSTLGRAVAARCKCAFFDAEDYYWLPTLPPLRQKRQRTARLALLLGVLNGAPSAVLGGSIIDWGAELEDSFNLIVSLAFPAAVRLDRLKAREDSADPAFLDWAAKYDDGGPEARSRLRHERWLSARACPVLRLDGDLSVEEGAARVLAALVTKT
jgi:adenylate kinase family enzyme